MTEPNSVTIAVTSIEARDGTCVVCVSIKNPPWAPISVEVPVKDLTDPTDALEQARTKVKEFGEALALQNKQEGFASLWLDRAPKSFGIATVASFSGRAVNAGWTERLRRRGWSR